MYFEYLILTIIVLFIAPLIINYFSILKRVNAQYGFVELRATKTHNNRGLEFTRGKSYVFGKNGNMLICNSDDRSRDRDNYSFFKTDLEYGFESTDLYSKLVLNKITEH